MIYTKIAVLSMVYNFMLNIFLSDVIYKFK